MKVLHVYRTYFPDPPGGVQQAIRHITASCRKYHGIEAQVFTLSPNPIPASIDYKGMKVHRSRSWWAPASCDIGGLDAVRSFRTLANWADILHFHFPWPFQDILNRTLDAPRPTVITYHSDIVRQKWLGAAYAPLMHSTLRNADRIVATSGSYAQSSNVLSGLAKTGCLRVIPLGIDEVTFFSDAEREAHGSGNMDCVTELSNTRAPFILFIGAPRYYKGLEFLLQACQQFRGQVVIVGSGPELTRLLAIKQRLQLVHVQFLGYVSERQKIELLRACTALVLPSHMRSEAFGMVLAEASMMSKPVISCHIDTGTSFVNKDGETGLVIPPASPTALADAMQRLTTDTILASKLGRGARKRYEQYFSGKVLGNAYADLYREAHSLR